MMETRTVQLRARGNLTLPAKMRKRYHLVEGDPVTLVDLDGVVLMSPKISVVDKLGGEIERLRKQAGLSVEDLLEGLPRSGKPVDGFEADEIIREH